MHSIPSSSSGAFRSTPGSGTATTLAHYAASEVGVIVCYSANDVPPGRQRAKILQCGICMFDKFFDRKHELERHMAAHYPGKFPCLQVGCALNGAKAFKRADKLLKHVRAVHGM